MEKMSIFNYLYDDFQIKNKIKLIELFAGYGSQSLALKYLGANYDHHKICEWATKSIQAYNDLHIRDYKDYSQLSSFEDIVYYLEKKGISIDYKNPMTEKQIRQKGEKWCRNVYNNIIATKNLVNIQQVKGKDLDITDIDNYTYLLTYSYPCQSLSLAGNLGGMEKGSGTESSMLWEVERILKECDELGKLPQILIMENVPNCHGANNIEHFNMWIRELEKLGYQSYYMDLNSKDFGVPQNRERCFMISILGDYCYDFPKKIKLKYRLKDFLEKEVDENYYLSDKMIKYISNDNEKWTGNNDKSLINKTIASTINTAEGQRRCDASNFICEELEENFDLKNIDTKRLYGIFDKENKKHQAGSVWDKNGLCPTLDTMQGGYRQPCIEDLPKLIGGVGEMKSNGGSQFYQQDRIYDGNGIAMCHPANLPSGSYMYTVESKNNLKLKLNTEYKKIIETIEKNELPIGEVKHLDLYNRKTTENYGTLTDPKHNNNRLWDGLRVRKLTPKECWRLMGVKDEDYEKVCKNQSNSSLYHLAGDSIVTTCLMALFGKLLDIDYKTKINYLIDELKEKELK